MLEKELQGCSRVSSPLYAGLAGKGAVSCHHYGLCSSHFLLLKNFGNRSVFSHTLVKWFLQKVRKQWHAASPQCELLLVIEVLVMSLWSVLLTAVWNNSCAACTDFSQKTV